MHWSMQEILGRALEEVGDESDISLSAGLFKQTKRAYHLSQVAPLNMSKLQHLVAFQNNASKSEAYLSILAP